MEEKVNLDKLSLSPSDAYYFKGLDAEKKAIILQSIKEKFLTLSEENKIPTHR